MIAALKSRPDITQSELAESTGLTVDGVRYTIKKAGILSRTGSNRSGRWVVHLY
ncbi:MAG TPA: winged helix-turn-helix domain-containing protein [Candidatus Ruminococcus avistercoris]|nr:winged helix-turn-helix domain-containing protein [Candidatus Ruminococcus avistercoris]